MANTFQINQSPSSFPSLRFRMSTGLRSPPSRSSVASPRPKFDADLLKAYMKKLLVSTLQNRIWPEVKDKENVKLWMREIGERVKERMLEIQPRGL